MADHGSYRPLQIRLLQPYLSWCVGEAPPRGGPGDGMYDMKNAKISLFVAQPHKIILFVAQGGETTYLSEPHLLSYLLSSQSLKKHQKVHFQ